MKRIIILLTLCALLLNLCACGGAGDGPTEENVPPVPEETSDPPVVDPSGAAISIPEEIDSIVVLAPALAEIVNALGLGSYITGYDLQSAGLPDMPENVPAFDMVNPDMEQLTALVPDVLLVSNLSLYDQEAPYQPLIDLGVCVICVPTSESIDGIKSDIRFLADVLGVPAEGEALVTKLDTELDELAAIAAKIPREERKRVYFEISAAPYMYSTGGGTYLNEMIEWIGAENIFAGETGWLSVEGESVVSADPDVIFTNVDYIGDPVGEILGRDGWAGVTAVAGGNVYSVDKNASTLPNQNIVLAMRQMAQALYPDYYTGQ